MSSITNDVILLAATGLPVILLVLLRINGAIAFLSLCAGSVLLTFAGSESGLLASTISRSSNAEPFVNVAIILLPAIFCLILLRKSVPASKGLINIVPAVCAGLIGALVVVPVLPGGVQADMMATQVWRVLTNFQELIVLGGVLASVLFLMITHPKEHKYRRHR